LVFVSLSILCLAILITIFYTFNTDKGTFLILKEGYNLRKAAVEVVFASQIAFAGELGGYTAFLLGKSHSQFDFETRRPPVLTKKIKARYLQFDQRQRFTKKRKSIFCRLSVLGYTHCDNLHLDDIIPLILVNLVITVELMFLTPFYKEVIPYIFTPNEIDALASDLCPSHAMRPLPNIIL
jgi:hypothetical protein